MTQNLKLRSLLIIFFFAVSFHAAAADAIIVRGAVYDRATDKELFGATARLLNASDSAIVAETVADGYWGGNATTPSVRRSIFMFYNVDRTRSYILELTADGYQHIYVDVDPATLSRRLDTMDLGKIYINSQAKMLDEVVVKASRVMFYSKGDTVIYNADAFVLAEGSMLDALISQMPGVELKDDGQIYVNGRYVENLLLNGKDFFKGNKRMMLDNLGAYTVKDIAVYERQDEADRIMGKDYGERHLSMDVRLKKEYNHGLLTNMEAGYGSSDRYLGRIFALWYADNARLSLYGSANNLSDRRKPGQDTDFKPGSMQSGDLSVSQGGFDYWVKIPYRDVTFSGDVMASRQSIDDDRSVLTTNFLPGGNTYGYSYSLSRNRSLSLSTSHTLDIEKPKWNLKVSPAFSYNKNDDATGLSAATFSEEWKDAGKDFIDNLYHGAPAEVLASILNRNIDDSKRHGHSIDASVWSNGKFKLPNDADAITYLLSGKYKRHHFDRYQRYILNFGADPTPSDHFDRYFDDTPDYRWSATGAVGYIWAAAAGMFLDSWYQYDRTYSREVSNLYRLENIFDAAAEDRPSGWLPSMSEYESTLDLGNSFNSSKTENLHSINFKWTWWPVSKLYLAVNLPVCYREQHLHYIRGDINSSFSRKRIYAGNASFNLNYFGRPHFVYVEYKRNVSSPDPVDMVDFTDALDPLNIRMGNPELKDSESHQLRLTYRSERGRVYQRYSLHATVIRNALAYGYGYDSHTGVKTGKMYNVNGNHTMGASQDFAVFLGSARQFIIGNTTTLDYRRSVDLISENTPAPARNKVGNIQLNENLNLSYRFGKSKIALEGEARISHFTGGRASRISRQRTSFTASKETSVSRPDLASIPTLLCIPAEATPTARSTRPTVYGTRRRAIPC